MSNEVHRKQTLSFQETNNMIVAEPEPLTIRLEGSSSNHYATLPSTVISFPAKRVPVFLWTSYNIIGWLILTNFTINNYLISTISRFSIFILIVASILSHINRAYKNTSNYNYYINECM